MIERKRHEIRRAQPDDAESLVDLVKRGMPGYPFESVYDVAAVEQSLVSPTDYRVVSVDRDGRIVGTAVLGDIGDHMQEIKRVVVDPTLRRNGIAFELTLHLVQLAGESWVVPWMDARADQPGMQRAGLRAGMSALSLEIGKHCVYFHLDNEGVQIGPGRETMIHITSLKPDLRELVNLLSSWPLDLVESLVANIERALNPPKKNPGVVAIELPCAAQVRQRIESEIAKLAKDEPAVRQLSNPDLAIVSRNSLRLLVVKPDASGFLIDGNVDDMPAMVQLGHAIGLSVMTIYVDIVERGKIESLRRAGMQPAMVRLRQSGPGKKVVWQVGWRSVAHRFDECLHSVNIDDEVSAQINKLISNIC